MELKQLSYYIQLYKEKNFSNASKNLFLTQQGLSKAIRNLEEELGVELIVRTNSGLEITDYGEYFYERAKLIITEITETINEINRRSNQCKAKLNVGFTFGAISALNPDMIFAFKKDNPDIILSINEYPDLICEQMLNEGALDIAVVVSPTNENLFKSISLLVEPLNLLISTDNPLAKKEKPLTMKDIKEEYFLCVNDSFNAPKSLILSCKKAGFTPNILFNSAETFLLQEMAIQNKGIYLMPQHSITSMTLNNAIFKPFPDPNLKWELCLITRKNETLTYPIKNLYDYLLFITSNTQKSSK